MKETELYQPVKKLLESMGYHVKGEIGAIDIFGVSENTTIAVELKTTVNLKLFYQAIDRQKLVDKTYIAVPTEALKSHRKQIKSFHLLIKKLELGLIEVMRNEARIIIDINENRLTIKQKKNTKKGKRLIKEFNERQNNQNIGGTNGKKITAYKEKAIRVAVMLDKMKTASPIILKNHTGIDNVGSILTKNYYQWFERIDRGLYQLSSKGENELIDYLKVIDIK